MKGKQRPLTAAEQSVQRAEARAVLTGKKQQHPVSEAQRRWAWANLPEEKAHEWSRRVKGKDLPEYSHGSMAGKMSGKARGGKYLSRRPDGKGGWIYNYGAAHEHKGGAEKVKISPRKAAFKIKTREGHAEREGKHVGDYAVHKEGDQWKVTHKPSGMAVTSTFHQGEALAHAHHLDKHAPKLGAKGFEQDREAASHYRKRAAAFTHEIKHADAREHYSTALHHDKSKRQEQVAPKGTVATPKSRDELDQAVYDAMRAGKGVDTIRNMLASQGRSPAQIREHMHAARTKVHKEEAAKEADRKASMERTRRAEQQREERDKAAKHKARMAKLGISDKGIAAAEQVARTKPPFQAEPPKKGQMAFDFSGSASGIERTPKETVAAPPPEAPRPEPQAKELPKKRELTAFQQAAKERAQAKAEALEAKARAQFEGSRRHTAGIPMGQPILVGHHSEKKHRRALERQDREAHTAMATQKEADRARSAVSGAGRAISSDDPEAVQALQAKVDEMKASAQRMKDINKVWGKAYRAAIKKHGATEEGKAKAMQAAAEATEAAGLADSGAIRQLLSNKARFHWEDPAKAFPAYATKNLNANIRRTEQRMEQLRSQRAEAPRAAIERQGHTIEEDKEGNRIRFTFHQRPSKEVHRKMRQAGFVYSRMNGAYQRKITPNARAAAERMSRELFPPSETEKSAAIHGALNILLKGGSTWEARHVLLPVMDKQLATLAVLRMRQQVDARRVLGVLPREESDA